MRRGLLFLAGALALPASRAQAAPQGLFADTVLLEHDQIPEVGAPGPGTEDRRRTSTQEGPVLAATQSGPTSAREATELTDPLKDANIAHTRDYLNTLVEASVADTGQQLCNLAFLKTHKTGSTTLSSLFYRYGVRHGLKVARYDNRMPRLAKPLPVEVAFPKILKQCEGRVDIMHYHIGTSSALGSSWSEAAEQYKTIMRDPDTINFVTIIREPRSHFLSFYYYFISHNLGKEHVEKFLLGPSRPGNLVWEAMHNPLAGELGINTPQELEDFLENDLPTFKLVLLTDRFTEGLMLLRNMFKWHLIDLSYVILNQTSTRNLPKKQPAKGKRPTFGDLSIEAQNRIDEWTLMDKAIYEAATVHFEKALAPLARQVQADVIGFNLLQKAIDEYLESNRTSPAREMYAYEDFFLYYPPASKF